MSYQREFERRLNVGVVGVGSHAYRNILPTLHFLPVRLVALCDLNLDLARRTAAEYGVAACYTSAAEMYRHENLDAVFLCVSARHHPQLACEGARCGHAPLDGETAVDQSGASGDHDRTPGRPRRGGGLQEGVPARHAQGDRDHGQR